MRAFAPIETINNRRGRCRRRLLLSGFSISDVTKFSVNWNFSICLLSCTNWEAMLSVIDDAYYHILSQKNVRIYASILCDQGFRLYSIKHDFPTMWFQVWYLHESLTSCVDWPTNRNRSELVFSALKILLFSVITIFCDPPLLFLISFSIFGYETISCLPFFVEIIHWASFWWIKMLSNKFGFLSLFYRELCLWKKYFFNRTDRMRSNVSYKILQICNWTYRVFTIVILAPRFWT